MTDYSKMTLDECRDWLAINSGVEFGTFYPTPDILDAWPPPPCRFKLKNGTITDTHPINDTFDAIAACIPDGWDWVLRRITNSIRSSVYYVYYADAVDDKNRFIKSPTRIEGRSCETPELAMARLAVACHMAEKVEKEINPNNMSFNECGEWLAKDMGWCPPGTMIPTGPGTTWPQDGGTPIKSDNWVRMVGKKVVDWGPTNDITNLLFPTIDSIAASMPDGWVWWKENMADRSQRYCSCPQSEWGNRHRKVQSITATGDEKLDRIRLAVACRICK